MLANLIIQSVTYAQKFLGLLRAFVSPEGHSTRQTFAGHFSHIVFWNRKKIPKFNKVDCVGCKAQVSSEHCGEILSCFFHSCGSYSELTQGVIDIFLCFKLKI